MDIERAVQEIDAEIATRQSQGFGIKMGSQLYRELFRSDLISMEKFGILEAVSKGVEWPVSMWFQEGC